MAARNAVEPVMTDSAAPRMRRMRISDIPAVHRIERLTFDPPWSPAYFRKCLQQGCPAWVLLRGERIAAYLIAAAGAGVLHLLNLCVDPESRRQGFGRMLLRHAVEWARQQETVQIILEVRVSNQAALELYHSEGFQDMGIRKGYYPAGNGREDAQVLCLKL